MTPLQEAAKAARDAGLDLPVCKTCSGTGEIREWICGETERYTCDHCARCGVDTSDPYALLGRALEPLGAVGGHAVGRRRRCRGSRRHARRHRHRRASALGAVRAVTPRLPPPGTPTVVDVLQRLGTVEVRRVVSSLRVSGRLELVVRMVDTGPYEPPWCGLVYYPCGPHEGVA